MEANLLCFFWLTSLLLFCLCPVKAWRKFPKSVRLTQNSWWVHLIRRGKKYPIFFAFAIAVSEHQRARSSCNILCDFLPLRPPATSLLHLPWGQRHRRGQLRQGHPGGLSGYTCVARAVRKRGRVQSEEGERRSVDCSQAHLWDPSSARTAPFLSCRHRQTGMWIGGSGAPWWLFSLRLGLSYIHMQKQRRRRRRKGKASLCHEWWTRGGIAVGKLEFYFCCFF